MLSGEEKICPTYSCSTWQTCDFINNDVPRLSIVESIPENLTYTLGSPSHRSTYQGWMDLLTVAKETVDVASYYWTLQGRGNISDITDNEVNFCE